MSAGASGEAMELLSCLPHRRLHGYECRFANLIGDEESAVSEANDCTCGSVKPMLDFVRKIDALVQRKVEEERAKWASLHRLSDALEGCYAGFEIESDGAAAGVDGDDPEQFMRAAASAIYEHWKVIRTPPPSTRG